MEEILKIVNARGSITVAEAAEKLGVSPDTVRRDFIRLTENGLVRRSHGGIVSIQNTIYGYPAQQGESESRNRKAKQKIAKKAVSFIKNGSTIILDGGTTTLELAKLAGQFQPLTVLTYGLNIAYEIARFDNITTILFGGIVSNESYAALGPDTVHMIRQYQADTLFLGANALHFERGLMTPNRMQADIKRELLKIADNIIVLADSTKINKSALFAFCSFQEITTFITDENIDEPYQLKLEELGIDIVIAD